MIDDVFCKIIKGELKGDFLYRDDDVVVIRDINPHAPVHLLIIPVRHFDGIGDAVAHDEALLGKMVRVAHQVAQEQKLTNGYRIIMNEGEDGGKLVPHLHIHLLGGKRLGPKLVAE
jgi:histidine triad (HIT) family protein